MSGCVTQPPADTFSVSHTTVDLFADVPRASLPEVKEGYTIYLTMLADADVVTDSGICETVVKTGKTLAQYAERSYFPYVFTVLRDERILATSTSGGYIYLTTGMLNFIETNHELAAVIAHEIAHTQYRRMKFKKRKHLMNLIQSLAGYSSYALGPAGIAIPKSVKLINNLLIIDPSTVERVIEADTRGCGYLKRAQYRSGAWYRVIERMARIDAGSYSKIADYLHMRPVTKERIIALKKITGNAK